MPLSNEEIKKVILNNFEAQQNMENPRCVFWNDPDCEFEEEFLTLNLEGIEKVKIENNEFTLKYRILREEQDKKFLLYRTGETPKENWLKDIEIASPSFTAERDALILSELGLSRELYTVIRDHIKFFDSQERTRKLKSCVHENESYDSITFKMLTICSDGSGLNEDLSHVLYKLLNEAAENNDKRVKCIERCVCTLQFCQQQSI